MCKYLNINETISDIDPKTLHDQYLKISREQKDELWTYVQKQTKLNLDLIQRFYFFEYTKDAYTGNMQHIKYDITKLVRQENITATSDIQEITRKIYTALQPQIKEYDLHPGTVQHNIYQTLHQIQLQQTPMNSDKLRRSIIDNERTPQIERLMNSVLSQSKDFTVDQKDVNDMIAALTELVKQNK